MILSVRNHKGQVFSNDMSDRNKYKIIEIHFCDSYTQIVGQKEVLGEGGNKKYSLEDIFIPLGGSQEFGRLLDLIAIEPGEIGSWI